MFQLLTRTGLSVAFLALTSAAALAQDASDEAAPIAVDEGVVVDGAAPDVTDDDMIAWSGVVDEETGDEVSIEEVWVDDGAVDDGTGEDGAVDDVEYVYDLPPETDGDGVVVTTESDCGGCEFFTADSAGRPVMYNARGDEAVARTAPNWGEANDIDIFARGNICFSAETYVGFLCDWQRPFLGDMMPAQ